MDLSLESRIFTGELTNDTLTITESMGVKRVSVFNGTTTDGTVLGDLPLADLAPSVINVAEDESFTVEAIDGSVIKNLVINAPADCTLKVVAQS
jgi:hypothetical protein